MPKGTEEQVANRAKPRLEYEIGETVRVREGPFADFSARSSRSTRTSSSSRCWSTSSGRETPVELRRSARSPSSTTGAAPRAAGQTRRSRSTPYQGPPCTFREEIPWPRRRCWPSSRSRSPPARPRLRPPWALPWVPTAWPSWTSARPTTPPPSPSGARSSPSTSRCSRTARSRSSSRPRRRPCCCARRPAWRRRHRPRQGDRWPGHRRPGRGDRQDQDARPQRLRPRSGQGPGGRHRPVDGHRGRLTTVHTPPSIPSGPTGTTSPGGHDT